eukprot:gene20854-27687_t
MALRGQGTLQSLLGRGYASKQRHRSKSRNDVHEPGFEEGVRVQPIIQAEDDVLRPPTLSDVQMSTMVVGHKHYTTVVLSEELVTLRREPDNLHDQNAIQVVLKGTEQVLGHVPAQVSEHLAGLMDEGLVHLTVRVIPSQLQLSQGLEGPHARVVAAAEARAAPTGEMLRQKLTLMIEETRRLDGHLFSTEDLTMMQQLLELSLPAQCLALRLILRKGPWFQLDTLYNLYPECMDAHSAVAELVGVNFASTPDGEEWSSAARLCGIGEMRRLVNIYGQDKVSVPTHVSALSAKDELARKLAASGEHGWLAARSSVRAVCGEHIHAVFQLSPAFLLLIQRVQRVFFLNEAQDLSSFVATERGDAAYPRYTVCRSSSAFQNREALLAYELALCQAGELEEKLQEGDLAGAHEAVKPAWQALRQGVHKHVSWKYQHVAMAMPDSERDATVKAEETLATTGRLSSSRAEEETEMSMAGIETGAAVKAEETSATTGSVSGATVKAEGTLATTGCVSGARVEEEEETAMTGIETARYTSAWVYTSMATVGVSMLEQQAHELSRMSAKAGDEYAQAAKEKYKEATDAGLKDVEWVRHGGRLALQRRFIRLSKPPVEQSPPERVIYAKMMEDTSAVGAKCRYLNEVGEQVGVEMLALEHYSSKEGGGWSGTHCEGIIWSTLFGLLMWDVIFLPIPEVFRSPFQTAPLDLGTDAFYPCRRGSVDRRLQEIENGGACDLLTHTWKSQYRRWCKGVDWDRFTLDQLLDICRCVGSLGLAVVCRTLAEDYNCGGFPDLLLWRPKVGDAKLSEVKSQRDRLSDSQRSWIMALRQVDVDCEVFKVLDPITKRNGKGWKAKSSARSPSLTPTSMEAEPSEQRGSGLSVGAKSPAGSRMVSESGQGQAHRRESLNSQGKACPLPRPVRNAGEVDNEAIVLASDDDVDDGSKPASGFGSNKAQGTVSEAKAGALSKRPQGNNLQQAVSSGQSAIQVMGQSSNWMLQKRAPAKEEAVGLASGGDADDGRRKVLPPSNSNGTRKRGSIQSFFQPIGKKKKDEEAKL